MELLTNNSSTQEAPPFDRDSNAMTAMLKCGSRGSYEKVNAIRTCPRFFSKRDDVLLEGHLAQTGAPEWLQKFVAIYVERDLGISLTRR